MIRHLSNDAASNAGQDQQRVLSGRDSSTARRGSLDLSRPTADAACDERSDTPVCTKLDDAEVNEAAAFASNETGADDHAIAAVTGGCLFVAANPAGTRIVRTAQRCRVAGPHFTATMQGLAVAHDTWSRVDLFPIRCRRGTLSAEQCSGAPAMVPAA